MKHFSVNYILYLIFLYGYYQEIDWQRKQEIYGTTVRALKRKEKGDSIW